MVYLHQGLTKPLVELINLQTTLTVKLIYRRKEELIEKFSNIL